MKFNKRAGRVLSSGNEKKLRQALEALSDVLAQLGDGEENSIRQANGPELRTYPMTGIEVRAEDGKAAKISGYAARFNEPSVFMYGFRERILPGAFADSLRDHDQRALWQHDTARVLGRVKAGTLRLWEDDQGLRFELDPPDTSDGRDAVTLIARGDVDQMSFGFNVAMDGDTWAEDDQGMPMRSLRKVNLMEISPVTWPAYPTTTVDLMRSAPEWVQRALQPAGDDIASGTARARLNRLRRTLQLLST